MLNSFEVTREIRSYFDRAGLLAVVREMNFGSKNRRTIRLAVEGNEVPRRAVEGSLVVEVERVAGGWSVEGSVTQPTPDAAVTAILGFFGEYQPL